HAPAEGVLRPGAVAPAAAARRLGIRGHPPALKLAVRVRRPAVPVPGRMAEPGRMAGPGRDFTAWTCSVEIGRAIYDRRYARHRLRRVLRPPRAAGHRGPDRSRG